MGVKSFFHEVKAKVSASRLFKALITEASDVLAKVKPDSFKSVEVVGGGPVTPGCVMVTNFTDASHFKYMKYRIDSIDTENLVCKYTLIEGDVLGDKLEKIVYEQKFETSEDGGCVVKINSEYHTKGDFELKDEEVESGKEQSQGIFKACEEYLNANPHVCA